MPTNDPKAKFIRSILTLSKIILYSAITEITKSAPQKITKSEVVKGSEVCMAICLKSTSMIPKPMRTTAGYIHSLLVFSSFLERISRMAGKPTPSPMILSKLKSSLKIKHAASIGMKRERRWAASVFTIPIRFMEEARKRNIAGNNTINGK